MSHKSTPRTWLLFSTTITGLSTLMNLCSFFDHRRACWVTKFDTIWTRLFSNHLSSVTPESISTTESNAPQPFFFRSFSNNKSLSAPFSQPFRMMTTTKRLQPIYLKIHEGNKPLQLAFMVSVHVRRLTTLPPPPPPSPWRWATQLCLCFINVACVNFKVVQDSSDTALSPHGAYPQLVRLVG